jgi:hypothetical protein
LRDIRPKKEIGRKKLLINVEKELQILE